MRLESGTAFMPGVSEKRLEKAARKEKDKCAKFRLLACLGRKKGHSIRRIAKDLKIAYSTIRDWLLRMRDRGLKGRFNARQGAKSQAPPPDHPYRAALAQEESEKVATVHLILFVKPSTFPLSVGD